MATDYLLRLIALQMMLIVVNKIRLVLPHLLQIEAYRCIM
eukprot:CAMPEP_0175047422 /NCGR_PEP_ID=MMETSP0052_2-20121109/5584_1 /TAXON_ID=51329 ORGANISM="Polytomella parva, Strain SAG 63-3" /NCGR_SAMPLE_ID=MMETSP0052_2 /ASSEMBLY_ACC=CAM_ASM_000194 /LENGTH=39 /DNA_ID= /DNA_START= /DNA_END= /DNA_ORIENTATION=